MITQCPICSSLKSEVIFQQHSIPVFQNKIYSTAEEAKQALMGQVKLSKCSYCGFVYNASFNKDLMTYDKNYQNEQAHSNFFRQHLNDVFTKLNHYGLKGKKVVEIGCGKGHFLEMLLENEINIIGFDPAYEGTSDKVIKEYFSEKFNGINADIIILRHTLEHILNPFFFIEEIAKANNHKGYIFIEVPTFDWIVKKRAFWDIFYEHCNYFSQSTLGIMFDDSETGSLFDGQYIYLWANLSKLRKIVPEKKAEENGSLHKIFSDEIFRRQEYLRNQRDIIIWGGGAKGSTFLNLLDPNKKIIKYVIDINPAKQNKFIAHTAHRIYSPDIIKENKIKTILVMNENYKNEIEKTVDNKNIVIQNL